MKFLNPEAARECIRKEVEATPYAQEVWDLLESGANTQLLELTLVSRLPLFMSSEEIKAAIAVGKKAFSFLNIDRYNASVDAFEKSAAEYYNKYGTSGEF